MTLDEQIAREEDRAVAEREHAELAVAQLPRKLIVLERDIQQLEKDKLVLKRRFLRL